MLGLDLNTLGNPRLMVAEAELLILGIMPAMLHIFYMGHHSRLLIATTLYIKAKVVVRIILPQWILSSTRVK